MKCGLMPGDATRRLAKEIRAARAYSGLSREQLAKAVDRVGDTIGSWERGEWEDPPGPLLLRAIATETGIPSAYLEAGFLAPEDPAKRFAGRARREAEQRGERPSSEPGDHHGGDVEDADL